ncbi:MAG TPA: alpha-L-fucosidase, partial [Clostridiales bacterium]|nr:alpha-L-fucosidase [Clostridiales bacterium]
MKNDTDDSAIKWWQEARFGLFVHWGIYSALEGIWEGKEVAGIGEWIQARNKIPLSVYREYAKELTLSRFDAEEWVSLAKDAGMGYIVLTAKHHDGFAMYDTDFGEYSIVQSGPSHRDPAQELAQAARKNGLKMCFYYSHALDWEDPDGKGNDWDYDSGQKNFEKYFEGKCKHQVRELLTRYGDVGLLWFDIGSVSLQQGAELKNMIKEIQPGCLINGRICADRTLADYGSLGDNQVPAGKLKGNWETPVTLNDTW